MFVVGAAWSVAGKLHLASPLALAAVGIGAVAISLAVSAVTWRLIEVPANALGRRLALAGPPRLLDRPHPTEHPTAAH